MSVAIKLRNPRGEDGVTDEDGKSWLEDGTEGGSGGGCSLRTPALRCETLWEQVHRTDVPRGPQHAQQTLYTRSPPQPGEAPVCQAGGTGAGGAVLQGARRGRGRRAAGVTEKRGHGGAGSQRGGRPEGPGSSRGGVTEGRAHRAAGITEGRGHGRARGHGEAGSSRGEHPEGPGSRRGGVTELPGHRRAAAGEALEVTESALWRVTGNQSVEPPSGGAERGTSTFLPALFPPPGTTPAALSSDPAPSPLGGRQSFICPLVSPPRTLSARDRQFGE
ncbi:protein argonaute 2-like [Lynx canadensis]|uniref:protein argonaute 2-like n=1 Tax=Lynx canadensis TaxID=61383 RepID=UPI0013C51274|nr:protein argonaute 2-like [Lynx canadensis]